MGTTRVAAELLPNRGRSPNQRLATLSSVRSTSKVVSASWGGYSLAGGSPVFDQVVRLWVVTNTGSEVESFTSDSSMWLGVDGDCQCDALIHGAGVAEWPGQVFSMD
ncbi:MAG TPA: hypothetical protein VEK33_14270 [Terriglobales bacterium]|nr:hypothetical protein [Terriglobales bacterium]